MPPHDGLRFADEEDIAPAGPQVAEGAPKEAVASIQVRPRSLSFEHGDLLP
jgi:hypothetical protein